MSIDTSQFFEIFFEETEEQLQQLEALLLALDLRAPDTESLHAIFRIAHSIKGNAGTFGFTELTELTHVMESLLDEIRHGRDQLTQRHMQLLLRARDMLKMQLDGLRHDSPVDCQGVAQVRQELQALAAHQPMKNELVASAADGQSGYGFFEITDCP